MLRSRAMSRARSYYISKYPDRCTRPVQPRCGRQPLSLIRAAGKSITASCYKTHPRRTPPHPDTKDTGPAYTYIHMHSHNSAWNPTAE